MSTTGRANSSLKLGTLLDSVNAPLEPGCMNDALHDASRQGQLEYRT
jgi:hypothetical protein